MCIAIFSEPGVGYPTKEIFKRCWINNDDGAGYAYLTEENKWHIKKGFMTLATFWEAFEKENFSEGNTVAIHLRWGTSGKMHPTLMKEGELNQPQCHPGATHPFPITDNRSDLFELEITAENIIMHNGVVGKGMGDLSDTMVSVIDYVVPLVSYMSDDKIIKLLTQLLDAEGYSYGSRWWIGSGAKTYLLGDWIHDEATKIWYSKDEYLEPKLWEKANDVHPYWNDYGTRGDTGQRQPVITINTTMKASDFTTYKRKMWSWAKWRKYEKALGEAAKKEVMQVKEKERSDLQKDTYQASDTDDNIVEVYNSNNKCIALIDSHTGETIWESEPDSTEDEPPRHCNDCGANVQRLACQGGLCPYCYSVVFPLDGIPDFDAKIKCPTCNESNYIIDSTFPDIGDSECCRCGCLFVASLGKEGIAGWNEDTKAEHGKMALSILRDNNNNEQ